MSLNTPSSSDIPADSSRAAKARTLKCSFCNRFFNRTEHLKRHIRLHTGERDFQCPCGTTFSRSDVLARHVKVCNAARTSQYETPAVQRTKRTRVKRACDRCARLKIKCDYENPCQRCMEKELSCTTKRDQQLEEQHRELTVAFLSPDSISSLNQMTLYQMHNSAEVITANSHRSIEMKSAATAGASELHEANMDRSGFTLHNANPVSTWDLWTDGSLESGSASIARSLQLEDQDFSAMAEAGLLSLDLIGFSLNPFMGPFPDVELEPIVSPSATSARANFSTQSTRSWVPRSFCIDQIDPVEARCRELSSIMREFDPQISEEIITRCMNRRGLVQAIELCGDHYQRNHPILHSPTFRLSECPPILLLAMFCVGACYAQDVFPPRDVFKIAMGILTTIESLPHERSMTTPPLSTIQASIAACCVLACSNDETGTKYVGVYMARSISMAKRAKMFDLLEQADYRNLSETSFDWPKWIERETRKRIACALFAQDVAGCVFFGTSPSFSPLKLGIELPSYESCWIAESAEKCLRELQRTPSQPHLAQALQQLRIPWSCNELSIFEASAFGMFILIKGLHCLVWHAANYNFDRQSDVNGNSDMSLPHNSEPNLVTQLDQGLSGPAVAKMAEKIKSFHISSAMTSVNRDLDNWHQVWTLRKYRDEIYENRGFALDPMPFWWLAKALLLLHCDSTGTFGDRESVNSKDDGYGIYGHMLSQAKVFHWLVNFRKQRGIQSRSTQSTQNTNGDSIVDLMQPVSDDLSVN